MEVLTTLLLGTIASLVLFYYGIAIALVLSQDSKLTVRNFIFRFFGFPLAVATVIGVVYSLGLFAKYLIGLI